MDIDVKELRKALDDLGEGYLLKSVFSENIINNDIDILIIEIGLDKKKSIDKFLKLFSLEEMFCK